MAVGVSQVGSLADFATLVIVVYAVRNEIRPHLQTMSAGLVALGRHHSKVDDDRLQEELDVDDKEVNSYQNPIVCGGDEKDD